MTKKNRSEKSAGRVGGAADGATVKPARNRAPKPAWAETGRTSAGTGTDVQTVAKSATPVLISSDGSVVPVQDTPEDIATYQKMVASAASAVVISETDTTTSDSGTAVEPVAAGEMKMTQLNLVRTKPNGSATYAIPGVPGTVRIAKACFGGNTPPASFEIQGDGLATMNPEKAAKYAAKAERKAKLSETREQRLEKLKNRSMLQEKRAANAKARLDKAEKREADRLAKLAAKSGAPATGDVAVSMSGVGAEVTAGATT